MLRLVSLPHLGSETERGNWFLNFFFQIHQRSSVVCPVGLRVQHDHVSEFTKFLLKIPSKNFTVPKTYQDVVVVEKTTVLFEKIRFKYFCKKWKKTSLSDQSTCYAWCLKIILASLAFKRRLCYPIYLSCCMISRTT